MKDHKLEMNKYKMREYWNKRATVGVTIYEKVCDYAAPPQFNEIMNKLQKDRLDALLSELPNIQSKRVLEVGCGIGRWGNFIINKGAEYTGVDISPKMIEIAKKNVPKGHFYVIDGENLNFPDNHFDLVFSITVLHHIPYDKKENLIQEICRVVKEEGYIIIIEGITFKKPRQTFNFFPLSPADWIAIFEKHKCRVIKVVKHQFLYIYLNFLTRKFSRITKTRMFKFIWSRIVEKVATRTLPWRFFAGCGIIFKKVR